MGVPDIKKALEDLYEGTATVYDFAYADTGHGAKKKDSEPTAVYTDIPCRLSYERKEAAAQDRYGAVTQEIILFCDPQYTIKPGAKITVTQYGAEQSYECAGLRAVYRSHQEIRLSTYRERA